VEVSAKWRGADATPRGAAMAIRRSGALVHATVGAPSPMAGRELLGPVNERGAAGRRRRRWARSPWAWSCAPAGVILLVIACVMLVNRSAGMRHAVGAARMAGNASVAAPGDRIDLMPLIDPVRDAAGGRWGRTSDGFVSDSSKWSKLRIPYQPPEEYDFRIEFTSSGNEDVAQLFTAHGHECAWLMGAFKGSVCGLHCVGGKPANLNPTAVRDYTMTSGERHTSLLEVRKNSVAAYLDGKLLVRYDTDGSDLSTKKNWEVGQGSLGIGSYLNSTVFHKVEVVERSARQ
jgi:hypothetical protein